MLFRMDDLESEYWSSRGNWNVFESKWIFYLIIEEMQLGELEAYIR